MVSRYTGSDRIRVFLWHRSFHTGHPQIHWLYPQPGNNPSTDRVTTMDAAFLIAYLLPIGFLAVFIGNLGKRFILYLVWGCIAAVPVLFLLPVLTGWFPEIVSPAVTLSPVLEEFFKALPLAIPVALGRRSSNRDMLVYAMASGIGFSVIENWMLFSPEKMDVAALFIRSFSTSLMHGCTCGIIG